MKSLVRFAILAALWVAFVRDAGAQCVVHAPCSGQGLHCATPPSICSVWTLRQGSPTCAGSLQVLVLAPGPCGPGIAIPGLECAACAGCRLFAWPVVATIAWPGPVDVSIPLPCSRGLAGAQFCVQNVCLQGDCLCFSHALTVTLLP